ncbi:YhjD/YihY/BrkB family envelope integrity protein [Metamycoplasma equirhinis]|uniref:YhjD/YihY/BrkB family envelope integrity protein n=1 Tax=Metamycoplasma equirhinis TaxID=92402 RepID=UPI0035938789
MFNQNDQNNIGGWDKNSNNKKSNNRPSVVESQIVTSKKKNNFFVKILKWIIYGILYVAIPRYLRSSKTKGREIVDSAYGKLNSNEFAFVPAGYAMYLFLSFIPVSILLIGIIGSISERYEVVLKFIILGQIIPGISDIVPKISEIWKSGAAGAIGFTLFAFSIIWLASKGYSKFIFSIDALYRHNAQFRMIKTRIKGFILSLIISAGLTILLLGLTAFFTFLIEHAKLGNFAPSLDAMTKKSDFNLSWEFELVYWVTIIILLPVVTYTAFVLFFTFSPNFKLKFSQAHPGALISAVPTSLFILLFGSLTSLIRYSNFGVVASFMYIILFLSVTSYFIYMGVIVNSSFYHTFINLPTVERTRWFRRPKRII